MRIPLIYHKIPHKYLNYHNSAKIYFLLSWLWKSEINLNRSIYTKMMILTISLKIFVLKNN